MSVKPGTELDPEELIGVTFASRYDVVEQIGRGGMGIIYRARQKGLNRDVVLKVLPDNDGSNNAMARFSREAQQLSRLRHPNTVTIFDYGVENQLAYIAMEYVEGKTLKTLLAERGRLDCDTFLTIAVQILDALSEAHAMGIVHRDVKPANIMLCELRGQSNVVKILDFGLAKLVNDGQEVTKKQELVGSAYFLSPEQILLEEIDTRADVYALGVLFYTMLVGRLPFRGPDEMTTLYQHLHEEPKHLTRLLPEDHDIPPDIIGLVHRMLSKDREDRPKDAGEVLRTLLKIMESRGTEGQAAVMAANVTSQQSADLARGMAQSSAAVAARAAQHAQGSGQTENREFSLLIDTTGWGDGSGQHAARGEGSGQHSSRHGAADGKSPGQPGQQPFGMPQDVAQNPMPYGMPVGFDPRVTMTGFDPRNAMSGFDPRVTMTGFDPRSTMTGMEGLPGVDTRAWQMVPAQPDRRGLWYALTAVILVVGLIVAALILKTPGEAPKADDGETKARLVQIIDRAELLADEQKYAQSETLLRSVQDKLIEYPELLERAAVVEDRTVIARLMTEAKASEDRGDKDGAKKLYKQVLDRDTGHKEATARLKELVQSDRWMADQNADDKEAEAATEPAGLEVRSEPEGLVYVDELPVGETPLKKELSPGKHTIEVRSAGFQSWTKKITAESGKVVKLSARLKADPKASKITVAGRAKEDNKKNQPKKRPPAAKRDKPKRTPVAKKTPPRPKATAPTAKKRDREPTPAARNGKTTAKKDNPKPTKLAPTAALANKATDGGNEGQIASPRLPGKKEVTSAGALQGILSRIESEVIERNGFPAAKVRSCTSLLFREVNKSIAEKGSATISPAKIYYSIARWVRSGKATSAIAQGLVARYRAGRLN